MANPHVRENRAKGLQVPPARPNVANVVILPPRDRKGVTMAGLTVGQKRFGQTPPTAPVKKTRIVATRLAQAKTNAAGKSIVVNKLANPAPKMPQTGGGLPIQQGAPKYIAPRAVLPPPVQYGQKMTTPRFQVKP